MKSQNSNGGLKAFEKVILKKKNWKDTSFRRKNSCKLLSASMLVACGLF